jgi:hypothetical protein
MSTDTAATSTGAAPWGDNFDAETAWTLVTNLRADKTTLQEKVTSLTAEVESVTAERDAAASERDAAVTERDTARQDAEKVQRETLVARIAREHELPEDLLEFLTGDTEDAIVAKATRLAALGKPAAPAGESTAETQEVSGVPAKPTPGLTPGHGADPKPAFDPDAIASAARQGR